MPFPAIAWLIVQVVIVALSILLAPKPDIENARPRGLGDFDFPTATEGRVVPIVWGTCRVKAPNVVWYGDLFVKKITESIPTGMFSKEKITVGHIYSVGMDFAICEGPVNGLVEVEVADKPITDMIFGAITDPNPANTGTGILRLLEAKSNGVAQTWTFSCTAGGLFATFSVSGSVSGAQDPLLVNKRYENSHIAVKIDQGSNGFVSGDNFQVSTAVGGPFGGTAAASGVPIVITKSNHFGGRKKGGGIVGTLQFYDGVSNQAKDTYLTGILGTDVPGYVNVCHAVWRRGEIGESTSIREWAFTVRRFPDNLSLTSNNHIVNGTDANPAEVIYEILTNARWGLAISTAEVDLASFQSAGNTLFTENNGFSMVLDRESNAEDLIMDVLRQVDGVLYQTADGKFTLKLVRQDYTLSATPIIDEANVLELIEFSRGSWAETFNDVSVRYFDSTDDFKETFAMGQDMANFEVQGVKRSSQLSFPGIKNPATARQVAMRELKSLSFPHAKASVTANRGSSTLRPGDVVRFSWEALGITLMPMRVADVDLGALSEGQVRLELVQDIFGIAETSFAAPPGSGWTAPSGFAVAATTEKVFDSPYWFILTDSTLQGLAGERAISVVRRPNGSHQQFRQYVDKGDGAGYVETDISGPNGFTPTGTLLNSYAEDTADVEVSNLLILTGIDDLADLENASTVDIETTGKNMALVDDEIIAFEGAVDNGNGTWTLRNVHRGMLDTLPAAHSAGARAWVFHEGSCISDTPYSGTLAINAKHLTETPANLLGAGSATAQPLTFARRAEKPLPAGFFRINSQRFPTVLPVGDLTNTWAHRNRTDPTALDQSDGDSSLGLPASHEYRLTFFNYNDGAQGTQLREQVQTTTSYVYTTANQVADNAGAQPQAMLVRLRVVNTALTLNNLYDVTRIIEVFDPGTKAVDLNGTDELLSSAEATVGVANVFTIGVWVKRTDADSASRYLFEFKADLNDNNRLTIYRPASGSTDLRVDLNDSAGSNFKALTYAGVFPANQWVHIVVAFDGSEAGDPLRVYVDGTLRTATGTDGTGTCTDTARRVIVGGSNHFAGVFHSAAVWNVELTSAEVTAIYNAGNGSDFNLNYDKNGYVNRAALKHWFRLGEDSSPDGDIGKEYALNPTGTFNVMDAQTNVTSADVVTDAP